MGSMMVERVAWLTHGPLFDPACGLLCGVSVVLPLSFLQFPPTS